jgi:uncharacterized OB-fold protein
MSEQRVFPCPSTNVENRAYWDAAAQGKFVIKHCTGCGKNHFYPRAICPHCFSDATEWKESSGEGEIYSFSVMRRVPQPYAIAYVALDDGVTVMSNIVDCDFDKLAIGQRVKVGFRSSDGPLSIPVFELV